MHPLTACYVLVQSATFQVLHSIAVPFEEPRFLHFLCFGIPLPKALPIPPSMTRDCVCKHPVPKIHPLIPTSSTHCRLCLYNCSRMACAMIHTYSPPNPTSAASCRLKISGALPVVFSKSHSNRSRRLILPI